MAIEKNSYKVSKIDLEISPHNNNNNNNNNNKRGANAMRSSQDDDFPRRSAAAVDSDDDDDDEEDDFDDCDSGAGSDDVDLLELGESGEEFCRVGDQTCSIPFELHDLDGLQEVLSVDVWNDVLSEEERFSLSGYLPDLDQDTCMRTLKDVLTGVDLHFGSPMDKLFQMLKGGLCEPRVELYRQGLIFFQRRQHYHLLRQYHNTMLSNICHIKDVWSNSRYKGYSIEEKLRVLNIMKSQKSLMNEKMEDVKSDSSDKEGGDGFWNKKVKDLKVGKKAAAAAQSGIPMSSSLDVLSHASELPLSTAKHGRQNQKLKSGGAKTVMPKELAGSFPFVHQGIPVKSVPYGLTHPRGQHSKMVAYESGSRSRGMDQFVNDDEGPMYEVSVNRDQNFSRVDKRGTYKTGRNLEVLRGDDYTDSSMRLPRNDLYSNGRNPPVNQLSDIKVLTSEPSSARSLYEFNQRAKNNGTFQPEDQIRHGKGKPSKVSRKGNQMEIFDATEPYWPSKFQGEHFATVAKLSHHDHGDWNNRSSKGKIGRDSPDLRTNAQFFEVEHRGKALQESLRASSTKSRPKFKGSRVLEEADETESDSSRQSNEDEDDNPLMGKKWAYPRGNPELHSNQNFKKANLAKKDSKAGMWAVDGFPHSSRQYPDFSEYQRKGKDGYLGFRAEQKGKMLDIGQQNSSLGDLDGDRYIQHGQMMFEHSLQQPYKLGGRYSHNAGNMAERLPMPMPIPIPMPVFKGHSAERGKLEIGYEYSLSKDNLLDCLNHEEAHDSLQVQAWASNDMLSTRFRKKSSQARPDAQLVGCNSLSKKRKLKDELYSDEGDLKDYLVSVSQLQTENADTSMQLVKNLLDHDSDSFGKAITDAPTTDMEVEAVQQPDKKPKKKPFVLITPTNHSGFSFSIIHFLTSVRMSMITVLPEDSVEAANKNNLDKNEGAADVASGQDVKEDTVNDKQTDAQTDADGDVNMSAGSSQLSLPSITVQEIVKRVRLKPYDPCVLETQEPLLDLVRGVLKLFSSRTAPGGAKGWKPLVVYEKSSKSWSWIGPVSSNNSSTEQSELEAVEEMLSPDGWGLPHKMLVKLVDSFAGWLKNAQEILQKIGSLPAPPLTLVQSNSDEKERFKDLRAQKSLITITPSCEEVRSYFRKEEVLRYSIPDRAFFYTAVDGKKSIVAPLRRCGGKPTSKARDHFMLKRDRPPHVTILCLVRDAAARLPGSIGTRADVSTLIRDSQYIVEEVEDAQVNQVVSGALDRLHYERDPCVLFDQERKLWVYLHRDRDEEDFEDDGTSSTKKWKRPRKEVTDPVDQSPASVPLNESGEPAGSYPNVEPLHTDGDKKTDVYSDILNDVENLLESSLQAEQGVDLGASGQLIWDAHPMHPMQETQLLCQENSANDDFHHQIFGGEPPT